MRLVNVCLILILFFASILATAQNRDRTFNMPRKLKEYIELTMYPITNKTNSMYLNMNLILQPEHTEFIAYASRLKTRLKLHQTTVTTARLLSISEMQKIMNMIDQLENVRLIARHG